MNAAASARELLLQIVEEQQASREEVRGLRAEVQALRAELGRAPNVAGLVDALRKAFGPGRFSAASILQKADGNVALFDALVEVIDTDAEGDGPARALGLLLSRLPELEVVGSARGARVYRLRE